MFRGCHWRSVVIRGTMETPPLTKDVPEIEALVPEALSWTTEQCVAWLYVMGLPQYEECFRVNLITGRKLILLDASRLPRLGIHDWDHIKKLTAGLRELLKEPEPNHFRSLCMPHREPLGIFLDIKSRTGKYADSLTYSHLLSSKADMLAHCYGHEVDPHNPNNRAPDRGKFM